MSTASKKPRLVHSISSSESSSESSRESSSDSDSSPDEYENFDAEMYDGTTDDYFVPETLELSNGKCFLLFFSKCDMQYGILL